MNTRTRAYLELARPPNVCTAMVDVIAGGLFAGAGGGSWLKLGLLTAASACLYAGGAALNDVCDADRDARERPERPIPSGRIHRSAAADAAALSLLVGLAIAAGTSVASAIIAAALAGAIVLYDGPLKMTPFAPGVMGLCRALNLTLGISAAGAPGTAWLLAPAGLMWLYVTSVTVFARREATGGTAARLTAGTIGVCGAVAGLTMLAGVVPDYHRTSWLIAGPLLAVIAWFGFTATNAPTPIRVQRAVKTFLLALIMFDACIVAIARGLWPAIVVAAAVIPAVLLARVFRTT